MSKKQYTTYDEGTGRITGTVYARVPPIKTPFLEGTYDAEKVRIVNGVPVDRSESEIQEERVERATMQLRGVRNSLLKSSDWTQLPDAPVDKSAWATYRQALRDLPANTPDPLNVTWPESPTN
jgi:hypothetical protein